MINVISNQWKIERNTTWTMLFWRNRSHFYCTVTRRTFNHQKFTDFQFHTQNEINKSILYNCSNRLMWKYTENYDGWLKFFQIILRATFRSIPSCYGDRIGKKCLWYSWYDVYSMHAFEYIGMTSVATVEAISAHQSTSQLFNFLT